MTDLTAFASLPLDELTAELERMLANHHAPRQSYAERTTSPLPATASPSRDALPIPPPGLAVAGNSLSETFS